VTSVLGQLALALPAVFFVVDPIGVVPIFIAMTAHDTPDKVRAMAIKACITGALLLIFFALFGAFIFRLFSVTLPAFRVAGGLLLMITALDMVRARPSATRTSEAETKEGAAKDDIAIVPLAIPLLSGPGSIATVMVLMAEGKAGFWTPVAVICAIAITFLITWLLLRGAHHVKKVLGQTGIAIMQRVFGLILAAIAVQFIADGGRELLLKT
jgi:multiple antibiotic resistance protein